MITPVAGCELRALRALQGCALEAVAHRWAELHPPGRPAPGGRAPVPPGPAPRRVPPPGTGVAEGVAALLAALDAAPAVSRTRVTSAAPVTPAARPATMLSAARPDGRRLALREAMALTDRLAEAAGHVATVAQEAPVPWWRAVELADAVSTTAQALHMLAELELAAIPGP